MRKRYSSLQPNPFSPGLKRTPLSPIGKKAEEKFALKFCGWHVQRIVTLDCVGLPDGSHAEGCRVAAYLNRSPDGEISGRNEASHVIRRSRGGLFHHLVPQSSVCHRTYEALRPEERQQFLPMALRLAWASHHKAADVVPEPPIPEEEIDA